jgi:hypothetical protein
MLVESAAFAPLLACPKGDRGYSCSIKKPRSMNGFIGRYEVESSVTKVTLWTTIRLRKEDRYPNCPGYIYPSGHQAQVQYSQDLET